MSENGVPHRKGCGRLGFFIVKIASGRERDFSSLEALRLKLVTAIAEVKLDEEWLEGLATGVINTDTSFS